MSEQASADIQYTRNLGNFENIKISLGLTVDVKPNESYEEALDRVFALVDDAVEEKVNEVDAAAGKVNTAKK